MRYYSIEPSSPGNWKIIYDRRQPPNSSVTESWLTVGLENEGARLTFLEYIFEDDDPDGVREAYGCKYKSIYRLTADTSEADAEKIFAYTLNEDGSVVRGLGFDLERARAVYLFIKPESLDDEMLVAATEKIESAPRYLGEVESIIKRDLVGGRDDVVCFALIKNRY